MRLRFCAVISRGVFVRLRPRSYGPERPDVWAVSHEPHHRSRAPGRRLSRLDRCADFGQGVALLFLAARHLVHHRRCHLLLQPPADASAAQELSGESAPHSHLHCGLLDRYQCRQTESRDGRLGAACAASFDSSWLASSCFWFELESRSLPAGAAICRARFRRRCRSRLQEKVLSPGSRTTLAPKTTPISACPSGTSCGAIRKKPTLRNSIVRAPFRTSARSANIGAIIAASHG